MQYISTVLFHFFFFFKTGIKCYFETKITYICSALCEHTNFRSLRFFIIKIMSISHQLYADSNINEDQLCYRFVSVGTTVKTQLFNVRKQAIFDLSV